MVYYTFFLGTSEHIPQCVVDCRCSSSSSYDSEHETSSGTYGTEHETCSDTCGTSSRSPSISMNSEDNSITLSLPSAGTGDTSAGSTSMHVGVTSGESGSELTSQTGEEDVEQLSAECEKEWLDSLDELYMEIIKNIINSVLQTFIPGQPINEQLLLKTILDEMNYEQYYIDDTDSDNTFGLSDIMSESSASTAFQTIEDEFNDVMRNIGVTRTYLNQAGNKNLFLQ